MVVRLPSGVAVPLPLVVGRVRVEAEWDEGRWVRRGTPVGGARLGDAIVVILYAGGEICRLFFEIKVQGVGKAVVTIEKMLEANLVRVSTVKARWERS